MSKLLIVVACVPITPIIVGAIAVYRRWSNKRSAANALAVSALPFTK